MEGWESGLRGNWDKQKMLLAICIVINMFHCVQYVSVAIKNK